MRRILVRFFLIVGITIATVGVGFTFWLRDRYVVPIITYHHVGVPSDRSLFLNTVSAESFERQMQFLKRNGFEIISFDSLVKGIHRGFLFRRDTVLIQFDDGYEDNYVNALPILKKYGFPAMEFLISDLIGKRGFLTWDQVKEMEENNFVMGAHTRTHAYLPDLSPQKMRDEIVGSKKIIEQHLGHSIDYFAYPSGGFNVPAKQIAKEAGFQAAVTTNRGKDRYNEDLYELKRIRINDRDSRFGSIIMWFKLSGYYNLFRKSKDGE
ncbi:MAG: polysaccharide deacetylase family protein [Candidatus Omnitrophica bacterium]|nr:polysaccharide deacetylase family protein [Candidatus Omnitrophota bacterium]